MLQLEGEAKAAGYMSEIPVNLKATLGADYIVGWSSVYSIASRYSIGPSLYTFDPQDAVNSVITVGKKVTSKAKMVFPFDQGQPIVENWGEYSKDISPIWGHLAGVRYGFIIPNTTLFMAIGYHAGIHSGLGYKITQDDGGQCAGGCPYEASDMYNYFWLFDVNDMLTSADPWSVEPISYGKWSHPYDKGGIHKIGGGAFDSETNTLYLALTKAGKVGKYDSPPLILGYKVKGK
jgi:hypothetical protein